MNAIHDGMVEHEDVGMIEAHHNSRTQKRDPVLEGFLFILVGTLSGYSQLRFCKDTNH